MVIAIDYEFTIVYKLGRTHVVANALFKLLDTIKMTRVLDHIIYIALFMLQL
jgi:hypothetical protein